jgi:hypothetical protein
LAEEAESSGTVGIGISLQKLGRVNGIGQAMLRPMSNPYAAPAMTIANMRSLGVPSLDVTCQCGREAVDASRLSSLIEIPTLRRYDMI